MPNPISEHQKAAELLAAERTFLAWIRTSLALISLGFVVAKFGVWLGEIAVQVHSKATVHGTDRSVYLGAAMMGFGALLAIMAAWHCEVVRKAIERGEIVTNTALVISITTGVVALAGLMVTVIVLHELWRAAMNLSAVEAGCTCRFAGSARPPSEALVGCQNIAQSVGTFTPHRSRSAIQRSAERLPKGLGSHSSTRGHAYVRHAARIQK